MDMDMENPLLPAELRVKYLDGYYYGVNLHILSQDDMDADVAILVVESPIPATPLQLQRVPSVNGDLATVVGYGRVPGMLPGKSTMVVEIIEHALGMVLVGPSICPGDSGSPLLVGGRIVGVASFIYSDRPNPQCLEANAAYVDTYHHLPWIDSVLRTLQ